MVYKGADGLPAAKLIDLGLLWLVTNSRLHAQECTKEYNAPELLADQPYEDCHATDVFATGVSLFIVAHNHLTFANQKAAIKGKITTYPLLMHGSPSFVNIIN